MYFKWKDDYSVNIEEIDNQHKKLFEIGGRISDLVFARDEYDHYDEIMVILDELTQYTIYHFDFEEKLMEQYGYQGVDAQKIEHRFLVKKLQKMQNVDIDQHQKDAVMDLVKFVSDWISGHILVSDMKYREFFNDKGVR